MEVYAVSLWFRILSSDRNLVTAVMELEVP
jgi:hypothetical protein